MFIRWAFCCIFYWRDIRLTAGILPMRFFFTLCLFLAGVSSRNEEPDFSAEEWRECSEGGKRLVTAMLQKNPENRISLEKVLEDPWTLHPPQRRVGVSLGVGSSRFQR